MSATPPVARVNSRQWWDDSFVHHWDLNNGREATANGAWPLGKEAPLADLSTLFAAAGLTLAGQSFGASGCSEDFTGGLPGLGKELCDQLAEKDEQLALIRREIDATKDYLNAILNSRSWRLADRIGRIWTSLIPSGSGRERMMRAGVRTARTIRHGLRAVFQAVTAPSRATIGRLVPASLRPYAKRAEDRVRRTAAWVDRYARGRALQSILNACPDRKGIVVLPPLIDWDWMKQRPHHLVTEFAKAGYLVFFCSPQTRTDDLRGFRQVASSLYLCSSPDVLNEHLQSPIVLATYPGHLEQVRRFKQPRVIYDHLDDLRVHCEGNRINDTAIAQHEALLRIAEVVCATSERLHMRVRAVRPDAVLCPNGVHYDDFALEATPEIPDDLESLVADGRPIVGYYGALAKWFDYGLLASVAECCPQYHFVLLGPDYDGSFDRRLLARIRNLHWLGEKKYEALPKYAYYFKVATIPFLINEITQCTSPVKLFEYMAAGKPIVTTDLPECRRYRSVLRASNVAEFVAQLDTAVKLGSDPQYREVLLAEARANTWRARFELIESRLDCGLRGESRAA
jgi:glycosyltransferase involved in cell wall biosynthesis